MATETDVVPLSTRERMSRQMTVVRLANGLMAEQGDEWHRMTILDIADAAVDVLVDDATLMPSERWDEECHRCEERIGDHLVDGRCPSPELLTADEREAMDLSGKLANLCRRIVGSGPQADHDWNELATRVHAVQHTIMSQAAARAYPHEFRLLGGTMAGGSMSTDGEGR